MLRIDPRKLTVGIDVAQTPRGPMPHVLGAIPRTAIVARWPREALPARLDDEI